LGLAGSPLIWRGTRRNDSPRQISGEPASPKVNQQLQKQHRPVMFHAEDGKNARQEGRVPGKANGSRRDVIHSAKAVNPMLQPVLSDITIDERVSRDSRKAENEKQTQRDTSEGRDEKKTKMLAQQFAHAGKYNSY